MLAICIPTYNRLHYLRESLEHLLPQAQELGISVCISDNHSTDGTGEYLSSLAQKHGFIRYQTCANTVGIDQNTINALSLSEEPFLLPIGDDEVLPTGSLSKILIALDEKPDLLLLDGWLTTERLKPRRRHLPAEMRGMRFSAMSEAFPNVWHLMPLGSFVFSRDLLDEDSLDRFIGTSHAYTGTIWDSLSRREKLCEACKVVCMTEPTVMLRQGQKSWAQQSSKILLIEVPDWFSLISERAADPSVVRKVRANYLATQVSYLSLARHRIAGQLNKSSAATLASRFGPEGKTRINRFSHVPLAIAWFLMWAMRIRERLTRIGKE